jgi:hypothetical protein
MVFAVPTTTSPISLSQSENTLLTQADDVGFAARAPPLAVTNVAITGGVTSMQGSAFAMHGQETVAALFGFDADLNATNMGVCSFHGDTLVLTDTGLLPIRDVNTEMSVWSRNPANGAMSVKPVQAQYSNSYDETVSVSMRDVETGIEQTIVSNRIHPYFVQTTRVVVNSSEGHVYEGPLENGYWVDASELHAGDRLLNDDGTWTEIVDVEVEAKPLTAFNLTVAEFHTYFVAANENAAPVWMHNDCFSDVNFRGLSQNRQLSELTDADLTSAFDGTDYNLSSHARAQIRDSRLSDLGFNTLTDVRQFFNRGATFDAGDGAVGRIYNGVSIIMDRTTRTIVTIRPGRRGG